MKHIVLLLTVLSLMVIPACAYETFVRLEDYVPKSEAIAVCVVEKDNGDGSVTAGITEILKGNPGKTEVITGETGHCVMHGPASRFMKAQNKYLVFLFKGNVVGRLGGILEIEQDKTLVVTYIDGFIGTNFNKETQERTLPVDAAKEQIKTILEKSTQ